MSSDPSPEVQRVILACQELGSRTEQVARAREICGHDSALFERVCDHLTLGDDDATAMDSGLKASAPRDTDEQATQVQQLHTAANVSWEASGPQERAHPTRVGSYVIRGVIGEGGMGVVYEAEQANPRRTVALKVLRVGLESEAHVSRFEREAQVLGLLDHVGISKVFEAGVARTPEGGILPYMVMERVEGLPLPDYIRENDLSVSARMKLLARICEAVQHAHARGVIHRDLKPGNILVEASGQPKVLDFGIARATEAEFGDEFETRVGDMLGTLAYMSPEQAQGQHDRLDARSDIYSLGVIGYEMLAGRRPHELSSRSVPEAISIIMEEEPTTLGILDAQLRGDAEVIIGKALSKDREHRYASAMEFGDDIARSLANEPITARPASLRYRLGRFISRHRALVAATAATAGALLAGLIGTSWYAVQEAEASRKAESAKADAELGQQRALLTAAVAALRQFDAVSARKHLENVPADLRDWTYRHVATVLADDTRQVGVFPGREASLVAVTGAGLFTSSDGFVEVTPEGTRRVPTAPGERLSGFSPDGRLLFYAGESEECLVLNRDTGERTRLTEGGTEEDCRPDFSPDGSFFRLQLGLHPEVGRRELGRRLARHVVHRTADLSTVLDTLGKAEGIVRSRRQRHDLFSRDGRHVLVQAEGPDVSAWLFDLSSGRARCSIGNPDGVEGATAFRFTADGERLLVGYNEGVTAAWYVGDCQPATWGAPRAGAGLVLSIATADSAPRACVTAKSGEALLLDSEDGSLLKSLDRGGRTPGGNPVFSADGQRLYLPGVLGSIWVYSAEDGEVLDVVQGKGGNVRQIRLDPTERWLTTLEAHGVVEVHDLRSRRASILRGHENYVYGVDVSPDGRLVVSSSWDRTVRVWDLETGQPVKVLPTPNQHVGGCFVAFSPDGNSLLSTAGARLQLWDTRSWTVIDIEPGGKGAGGDRRGRVAGLTWHPSGQSFVVVADRKDTRHYVRNGQTWTGTSWAGPGTAVAFSPSGETLALSLAEDNVIRLFDARGNSLASRLEGHEDRVRSFAWSPDGRRLFSASLDRTVRVWDVEEARLLARLTGHSAGVFAVAISPDGKTLASGGNDNVVRIWDAERNDEVVALPGHESYIYGLDFSPSGDTLASCSGDGTVRLWRTRVRNP